MTQYGWTTCPQPVRNQIEAVINSLQEILGDTLAGVYLHGSLALGCFNPSQGDVDVLTVTEKAMATEVKRSVAEHFLQHSANPAPIAVSFLAHDHMHPWRYPTPYDFHYSESWREKIEKELADDQCERWNDELQTDKDLAAHITVTRARGIVLYGKPIDDVFPGVPEEDYIDSLVEDFHWGRQRMTQYPTSFILNACRVLAYLSQKQILSKDEAGEWALHVVPEEFRKTVMRALEAYRGKGKDEQFAKTAMREFAGHMAEKIGTLLL